MPNERLDQCDATIEKVAYINNTKTFRVILVREQKKLFLYEECRNGMEIHCLLEPTNRNIKFAVRRTPSACPHANFGIIFCRLNRCIHNIEDIAVFFIGCLPAPRLCRGAGRQMDLEWRWPLLLPKKQPGCCSALPALLGRGGQSNLFYNYFISENTTTMPKLAWGLVGKSFIISSLQEISDKSGKLGHYSVLLREAKVKEIPS